MSNQACQTCKTVYTDEQKGGYTYLVQDKIIYCSVCTPNATPNDPKAIFDLCWSNGDEMAFLDEESLNVLIENIARMSDACVANNCGKSREHHESLR